LRPLGILVLSECLFASGIAISSGGPPSSAMAIQLVLRTPLVATNADWPSAA
jgi:hypothetical protein